MSTMTDPAVNAATDLRDDEELRRARGRRITKIARWVLPIGLLALTLFWWHWVVTVNEIPHYVLPGPILVAQTLVEDFATLAGSWWITIQVTFMALFLAVTVGVGLAILFNQSRLVEMSFFPYAVVLQVTPIIAIAPLIFIYVVDINLGLFTIHAQLVGLLICAWIVAFFPILSNTTLGLNSADHNLRNLFQLYGATRWQTLRFLRLPAALPYFLGGLRIAGGLSLIGAIVAEFVAGTGGLGSGLAFKILEASYRLNIPRMFAAILLISVTGIIIFACLSVLSHLLLKDWHESAIKRDA